MHRARAVALSLFLVLSGSCAASTRYSMEISRGPELLGDDGPRVQLPFSIPAAGSYDLVLWYPFTDAGAGYDALGRVSGTVAVTHRGKIVQQDTLPRRGKRSELFTDTNGLILIRLKARSAGHYMLRLNITSVPPHLEIGGAGFRIFKLAKER
jgi:hypothetical protein